MTRRGIVPALLVMAALSPPAPLPETAAPDGAVAHLVVRTLVMDALGTRTVDVAQARVPWNNTGLLMRQVPYGGPPLSFRLLVRPESPGSEGIRLSMTAQVWGGALEDDPGDDVVRREETALIDLESSFLLELAHERSSRDDGAAGSERRVVLSITVSDRPDPALWAPAPLREIHFLFQMIRQSGSEVDPPETHLLSSLLGRPVSYSSRAIALSGTGEPQGLTFTLSAEESQGSLVTVRLRVTGFDYADADRSRLVPVNHESLHTVRSGSSFLVEVPVGEALPEGEPGGRPAAAWVLNVTPRLA